MKKAFKMITIALIISNQISAQINNPFKKIEKPKTLSLQVYSSAISPDTTIAIPVEKYPTIIAWRITPMAGYNISTKQLMAGIGYGPQWTHYVDSTQKYYTTFSIQVAGWVNGNTAPSPYLPNFTSFGISVGLLNQVLQIGAAYTPKTAMTKQTVGIIINIGFAQNN